MPWPASPTWSPNSQPTTNSRPWHSCGLATITLAYPAPDFIKAEGKYIDLYKNTNYHRPELSYRAYLMAGRAALN